MSVSAELGFSYDLVPDKIYRVVAISFVTQSPAFGTAILFDIIDEAGLLMPIPACLFEVVDPRCSARWLGQDRGRGNFVMWPAPFFIPYFHDRLSEGERDAVAILQKVIDEMREEDRAAKSTSSSEEIE